MIVNLREFESGLDRWAQRELPVMIRRAQLKIAFDLFAAIVRLSPVDTGRYRGSWTLAAGSPDVSVQAEGASSYPVPSPPSALLTDATTLAALNVLWIANHLPYAEALETGHSQQAPSGVAGPVLAAFAAGGISRGVIAEDGAL